MKKIIYYTIILSLVFSCTDFVDIEPEGIQTPKIFSDYVAMLNALRNTSYSATSPPVIYQTDYITTRNAEKDNISNLHEYDRGFLWQEQFYSSDTEYIVWNSSYYNIYNYNVIITNVMGAANTSDEKKLALRANALVGRALEYLNLVNLFSKPYDATTAGSDYGIPYLTEADITQNDLQRGTVAEVYNNIINDLNEAIVSLPDTSDDKFLADKTAVKGVLARVYYYMREFDMATQLVDDVLQKHNTIINYNNVDITSIPSISNPEEIFLKKTNPPQGDFSNGTSTSGDRTLFESRYDSDDVRFNTNFLNGSYGASRFVNVGISVQEMLLIKAEGLARQTATDLEGAIAIINRIRENRIPANSYNAFSSDNKEEVITKIINERAIELAFRGLRWFDMRHAAKENRIQTITHTLYNSSETEVLLTNSLEPNSPRYTMQIPVRVIGFNPNMPQNE